MKLVVQQFNLQNPVWEGEASPGKKLKAKVDAPGITNSQRIEFSIRDTATDEVLDTVLGAAGKTYARWQVPNLPSTANAYFYASLREAPSPDNGQVAAIMW